jgi:hypothetical protein
VAYSRPSVKCFAVAGVSPGGRDSPQKFLATRATNMHPAAREPWPGWHHSPQAFLPLLTADPRLTSADGSASGHCSTERVLPLADVVRLHVSSSGAGACHACASLWLPASSVEGRTVPLGTVRWNRTCGTALLGTALPVRCHEAKRHAVPTGPVPRNLDMARASAHSKGAREQYCAVERCSLRWQLPRRGVLACMRATSKGNPRSKQLC